MRFIYLFPAWIHWRLPVLIAAFCCTSCSKTGGYNPVHGKVLYQNEPIEGVVVTFHPKGKGTLRELPVGVTGEDGKFELTTGKGEGAPEGEYAVTFYCPQPAEDKPGKKGKPKGMVMQRELEDRFKGAYANDAKSNFKVSIKNGKNNLEPFNLK
jgi:hypothetical protein